MKILEHTKKIAKEAGKLIVKKQGKNLKIKEKAKSDLVTDADKASEKLIIKRIKALYPSHAIIAEESAKTLTKKSYKDAEYIWIIDPIDGTINYAHGLPMFTVSIGIFKTNSSKSSKNFDYITGELVAGVVYAPKMGEIYSAEKGKGAFLNGKKIKVSKKTKLVKSLTVTGFTPQCRKKNLPYFNTMLNKSLAIRRLGSASLDLCYIACGRFDGYWEFGLKPWDIAAGALIIKEAGGEVTDTNGNQLDLFGEDILASNGKIHKEMIRTFAKL